MPRQVDADQGQVEEGLGHEVTVGHGVQGVLEAGSEAELRRDQVRIERQRRPGQRPRPERRHIQAAPGLEQAVDVAGQSPAVRQQVVGQKHGLGPLQVGVARQVDVLGGLGPLQQDLLQAVDPAGHHQQLPLGEEAQVGGDLVVAAPARVQAGADLAGDLGDPPLDGRVDVLVRGTEHQGAGGQLVGHPVQGGEQDLGVRVGEDADGGQPPYVGS